MGHNLSIFIKKVPSDYVLIDIPKIVPKVVSQDQKEIPDQEVVPQDIPDQKAVPQEIPNQEDIPDQKIVPKKLQDQNLAKWEESRWLVLSSSFLLIPASYGYSKKLYYYSGLLVFTALVSANYWRKATYSWRRTLDLIISKITFGVFTCSGIYYNYIPLNIFNYPGLIYCFYLSNKLWEIQNNNWWKYHMAFHVIISYESVMIIKKIWQI